MTSADKILIFVGSPHDMGPERNAARDVISSLSRDDRLLRRVRPFMYEMDFDSFTATHGPQQELQQKLDEATILICLFGERLGTPLPPEFTGNPMLMPLNELEWPVVHPSEEAPSDTLPLTGTVYELLYARKTNKEAIVLISGDQSVLLAGQPPHLRNFGHRRLLKQMEVGKLRLSPAEQGEYDRQTAWLCRFVDEFAQRGRSTFVLFGDEPNLRSVLDKTLRNLLGIPRQVTSEGGKGLDYYDIRDVNQFHGRREDVQKVLDLYRTSQADVHRPNLIVIEGVSGVGKSSFLRAGLAAALERGEGAPKHITCVARWSELLDETAVPFFRLAEKLVAAIDEYFRLEKLGPPPTVWNTQDLERWLSSSSPGAELVSRLSVLTNGQASLPVLMAIDQFEHLLADIERSQADTASDWEPVLGTLREVACLPSGLGVVALPDDWSKALRENPRLERVRSALRLDRHTSTCVLSLPDRPRNEDIIRGFFADRGLQIQPDLLDHLAEQIEGLRHGNGSFMPLLSQVLTGIDASYRRRMKAKRNDPFAAVALDRATFDAEAELATAINELGERAYASFERSSPGGWAATSALPSVLRRLTWVDPDSQLRTLRSATQSDFSAAEFTLLRHLGDVRLAERVGERWRLVHDSVIDHWKRARSVATEDREDAMIVSKLRRRAKAWHQSSRLPKLLIEEHEELGTGADFYTMERIHGLWCDELDPLTVEFLSESMRRNATATTHTDLKGNPRLYWVACSNSAVLVDHYLKLFPKHVTATRPENARAALHAASFHGTGTIVRALLEAGAEPNQAAQDKSTPLHIAAWCGNLEACRVLLERNADPHAEGEDGTRALDWAAQEGHVDVVDALLAHDASLARQLGYRGRTALLAAAWSGHSNVVERLLAADVEPRTADSSGMHPLCGAAQGGHLRIVDLLLSTDSELVEIPGMEGRTALFEAAGAGHATVVRRLLDAGADPTRTDTKGTRALDHAVLFGRTDVVRTLIEHDRKLADLHVAGKPSPLAIAIERQQVASACAIAAQDPSRVSQTDANGATALLRLRYTSGSQAASDMRDALMAEVKVAEPQPSSLQLVQPDGSAEVWQGVPGLSGTWSLADESGARELLVELDRFELEHWLPQTLSNSRILGVRQLELECYPQASLVEALCELDTGERCIRAWMATPNRRCTILLNGTSAPVHYFNEATPLLLSTPAQRASYLRFFCEYVHGKNGSFHILENVAELLSSPPNLRVQTVQDHDPGPNGELRLSANLLYGDIVIRAVFELTPNGELSMLEEDAVAVLSIARRGSSAGWLRILAHSADD